MAKKSVEAELQEATGIKPKAKEKRQDYLKRMVGGTGELDDEAWKNLTTPAQKWHNAATQAFDADKEIPDFEGEAETPAPKAKDKQPAAEPEEEDGTADEGDAEGETEEGDDAEEADADESEDNVSTKTKTKAPAKKAAAKPAAKAAKKAAAPAAKADKPKAKKGSGRGNGGVQAVLAHVLKNPDDSVADMIAALKKDGVTVTPATASSARGFFKLVVRFLQDKKLTTKKLFD